VILKEGDSMQRIYQVVSGQCQVVKLEHSRTGTNQRALVSLKQGELFGEISFLIGGGASADVVAESDIVVVFLVEAEWLKRLFNSDPTLAARFFKYLAVVIERRVQRRQQTLLDEHLSKTASPEAE
jgi:CRP-like cAMP-binding protein